MMRKAKELINLAEKKRQQLEIACEELQKEVQKMCEFDVVIECMQNTLLIAHEGEKGVATLDCLKDKHTQNKLTLEQFRQHLI